MPDGANQELSSTFSEQFFLTFLLIDIKLFLSKSKCLYLV